MMDEKQIAVADILFRVVCEEVAVVEFLRATPLGEDLFCLQSSPFYAYDVSAGDIVTAPPAEAGKNLEFVSVVERSGNRTVRVAFSETPEQGGEAKRVLADLDSFGCSFQSNDGKQFSVTIPPEVDFPTIVEYLSECAESWEYADPSFEMLYPEQRLK